MCKIAAVAGIKKNKVADTWMFLELLASVMSSYNRDGLGYAAITKDKKMFGEKWLFNNSAFRDPYSNKSIKTIMKELEASLTPIETYGWFGDKVERDEVSAIILHARAATTGGVTIANTHPFVDELQQPGVSLIHNGGIRNHTHLTKKHSECDSESILHEYIDSNVDKNMDNIQDLANKLEGWYACALLNNKVEEPYMDIFTDGTPVHIAYIEELGVFVFTTQGVDIMEVAKSMGYNAVHLSRVRKDTLIRINAITGKPMGNKRFNSDVVVSIPSYDMGGVIDMSSTGPYANDNDDVVVEEFPLSSLVGLAKKQGLE